MNRTIALACLMVPILYAGSSHAASGKRLSFEVDGGFSQPVGTEMTRWETGFTLGTSSYFWPAPSIGVGLRMAYVRWAPDMVRFAYDAQLLDADVTGSTSIIEIMPSLRLKTDHKTRPINFFGQVGTGLFAIRALSNVTGLVSGERRDVVFANGTWIGRWGFQVGPGISIGSANRFTVDIFSLYNLASNGNHAFQYFTGNAGLSLKFATRSGTRVRG